MKGAVNMAPREGYSVADMKKNLTTYEKLCKPCEIDEEIEFEDAEFEIVKTSFERMRWAELSPELVEFSNYLESL